MNLKEEITSVIDKNKVILKNFSYLTILQILNLIIPLLVYPYLIDTLGAKVFGLVIFAQAIISYLVILVGFGFNISGAKSISIFRDDNEAVSRIFSSIFFIKLTLFVISLLVLIFLAIYIPNIEEYRLLFFLTLWMCVYDIFFPIWYFQGIEKMKYITYISLIMKSFFLISVFVFINKPSDYLLIPIINIFGSIISGLIAFYIIIYKHRVNIYIPTLDEIKIEFNSSIPIFISNVSVQLYVATNKIIVGSFLGMASVTYYDLAEKVLTLLKTPQSILSQTIFPKISKEKNIFFVKRIFKLSLLVNTIIFLLAFLLSNSIVEILGKGQLIESKYILKILLITIPIIGMGNIFGIQVLIPFGYSKLFSKAILLSGLFYSCLLFCVWVTYKFTIYNVAYIAVVTELFVTGSLFYLCRKYKLW